MPLGGSIKCLGKTLISVKAITGAADNGAGLIRITATAHGFSTNEFINITGVTGTVEANGRWKITKIDANSFDLIGSAFAVAYIAGGKASKPLDILGNYPELRTGGTAGSAEWPERASQLSIQALPTNVGQVYVGVFGLDRNSLKGVVGGGILQPAGSIGAGLVRAPNALRISELYIDADTDQDGVISSYLPY